MPTQKKKEFLFKMGSILVLSYDTMFLKITTYDKKKVIFQYRIIIILEIFVKMQIKNMYSRTKI